ncbi:MAG: hypothetical protein IJ571_04785 [Ruminococcus sp.]|nr:hypothetical protein [Ruminococcus sp.]
MIAISALEETDSIVPSSYSEKAVNILPSAELIRINGAGRGFYGEIETSAEEESVRL